MTKFRFNIVVAILIAFLTATALRAQATPDFLLPDNLKSMGCSAPDPNYMFVESNEPGNVFYPSDPVDLTVQVTHGELAAKSVTFDVNEIGTANNRYLPGTSSSGMTPPPAVDIIGARGSITMPLSAPPLAADPKKPVVTNEHFSLPVPRRYGTYLVTISADGGAPSFLCTLIRAMTPPPALDVSAPVFGEGQYLTYDNPLYLKQRAETYARLGIRGLRIELGWASVEGVQGTYNWTQDDFFLNAMADAKLKALITLTGAPNWTMPFGNWTPACIPEKPDISPMPRYNAAYGRYITALCNRYWKNGDGPLWALENWNEPWDGISISGWESDTPHYRELTKQLAASARAVDPRIKIAAACSIMNTEDKFLSGDDRAEMIKNIDLFTDHYVAPSKSYGPMVAKYWGKESTDTESWLSANEVLLPQAMCQFMASGQQRVTPWHPDMISFGVPGGLMHRQMPTPVALASNVFNCLIGGKPFQRLLFLHHLPWAFQFGSDSHAVVVLLGRLMDVQGNDPKASLWSQVNLTPGGSIEIENADGKLHFQDANGNAEHAGERKVVLPLDYAAHYITSRGGASLISARLTAARIVGLRPVEIVAHDLDSPIGSDGAGVRVSLHNLLNRTIAGSLTVVPPSGVALATDSLAVHLQIGETADFHFSIVKGQANATNTYLFAFQFSGPDETADWREVLNVAVAKRATKAIDGNLADWDDTPGVLVDAGIQKVDPTMQAWFPFDTAQTKQPDGTFGEVKLAWDDKYLYVGARVHGKSEYAGHQRLATWDENQYFRGAADDATCESLRPYQKFVINHPVDFPNDFQSQYSGMTTPVATAAYEKQMSQDPLWPAYQKFLTDHPDARAEVTTLAATTYFAVKSKNPLATYADASYVYKKVPWNDQPWAGDVLQFGIHVNAPSGDKFLKPDTDRVPYGFHAMPDTDYEYAVYACQDGGSELWNLLAPGIQRGHHFPRQPRAVLDQGAVKNGLCAVNRVGNVTTYEAAIPWTELKLLAPQAGRKFDFTFLINRAGGPAVYYGNDKSATKTNGLSLHPYYTGKPSCSIEWTLGN